MMVCVYGGHCMMVCVYVWRTLHDGVCLCMEDTA